MLGIVLPQGSSKYRRAQIVHMRAKDLLLGRRRRAAHFFERSGHHLVTAHALRLFDLDERIPLKRRRRRRRSRRDRLVRSVCSHLTRTFWSPRTQSTTHKTQKKAFDPTLPTPPVVYIPLTSHLPATFDPPATLDPPRPASHCAPPLQRRNRQR